MLFKGYSQKVIDHFMEPRNNYDMPDADGVGQAGDPSCGDAVGIYIKVKEGRIAQLMREYGNLYCDLSACSGMNALRRDPEYAAKFIEEFADRMLYGCDICMPGQEFPFLFDEFLTSMRENDEISEKNYYKLVRGNAERLLGL